MFKNNIHIQDLWHKTILSRKFLSSSYCVLESFSLETIFVNKIWLHLLLSSFPSLLRLQNNVSGLLKSFGWSWIHSIIEWRNFSLKQYREKAANIQSCRKIHFKMQIFEKRKKVKYFYLENVLLESLHIKFQYLAQRVKRSFGKRPAFGTFLKQSNQKSL